MVSRLADLGLQRNAARCVCAAAAGLGHRYAPGCEVEYSQWAEVRAICAPPWEKSRGEAKQLARR
ncbi:hypothetical protein EYF80_057187 [Liparis tanakae]|uniref:Uncharacterized protein n=1 Tax=Liparis tanakae TaxID=230148 RepID=A0A4Z2EV36_9TELE|nr:hypothetical protein EYF80_057187 [Liparis tanakae]